jgi:hypothetical protein
MGEIQQRYFNSALAARYMGVTPRELLALPDLLQCRPLPRKILWDMKDLQAYKPKLPLPKTSEKLATLILARIAEYPAAGFIYFVVCRELVKVGFSGEPPARVAALQAVIPFELQLLGAVRGSIPAERGLHAAFSSIKSSVGHEWFYHSPALLDAIKTVTERGNING